MEKLLVFTALQEMWPYRTAWLLHMAEHIETMASSVASVTKEKLNAMLEELNAMLEDMEDGANLKNVSLAKIYKTSQGVMHSLPNSSNIMVTDANTKNFMGMLDGLVVGDLSDLRPFAFNLPRSLVDDIFN